MASSGVVTYRTNRDQIINGALRICSAIDPENTAGATPNQITYGAEALNLLAKQYEAMGLQLWERRYGVIFPQKSQAVYILGSPGPAGDHACLSTPLGLGGFVSTTLSSAAASGASTIVVTTLSSAFSSGVSVFTMATTYNIGIELDSGYIQWTTINGAPSGTTVTLAANLTGAAASGNAVYCYQTKLVRPLRILDAWARQPAGNDQPINIIPRDTYNRLSVKTNPSPIPNQLYYDPQANAGHLYIYPTFNNVDNLLYIEFQKPIDDFTSASDDFDLPQEWGNCLKWNLALMLAPEYDVPDSKFKQIQYLASESLNLLDDYDQETGSLFITPSSHMGTNG